MSLTFAGIVAFAPPLVFSASRISNDPLAEFLVLLAFCFLVKWWHEQNVQQWYSFNIVSAIGIITKLSVLPVLGTGLLLVGLKRDAYPEDKAKLLLATVIILAIISGWYFVQRQQELGNILPHTPIKIAEGLQIENNLENFTVFNPIQLVQHPFNDSWRDEQRRQYFWEYLYRSAFFGEFKFDDSIRWLAIAILLAGLPLIPLAIWGIYVSVKDNWHVAQPLCIFSALLILALITWRLLLCYTPTQDFRLISTAMIPIAYFTSRGLEEVPSNYLLPATILMLLSPALWAIFLLSLCFG
jgi:4-amino-4-deoxy-L-arabinose transferase-like glycosyltransferase